MEYRQIWEEFSLAAVLEQAPWWVVSAVVHLVLIIILAAVNFTTIPPRRREILINTEFVELSEREEPVTQRNIFDETTEETVADAQAEAEVELDEVVGEVPVLKVQPISLAQIAGLIGGGGTSDLDASGTNLAGLLGRVGSGRPFDVRSVVDALAKEILEEIQKHKLLVVMLFDESQSLLEDRRIIGMQIHKTITDLRKEMTPREAERLKWSVVSYGAEPSIILTPTGNLEELVNAVQNKVKIDRSGKENILQAIRYVLERLGKVGDRRFIVAVTDEEGTDVRKQDEVLATIQALRANQARLFIFGRESAFQMQRVKEWLRDKNGERLGPYGWAERGLETYDWEFFQPDWLMVPMYRDNGVPSGYGNYVQSMLAYQTGGTFFILSEVPSAYDEEKLETYQPEWDPPDICSERERTSPLRSTMNHLFKELKSLRPRTGGWIWITQLDRLKAATKEKQETADRAMKLIENGIDQMERLAGKRNKEKQGKERWAANYDVTMAELYRLKFLFREYIDVLRGAERHGYPKPEPGRKFNIFRIFYDYKATEPRTGRRGARDMARAKEALQRIIDRYDGTPYAEVARHELKYTAPLNMHPIFHVEPTRPNM